MQLSNPDNLSEVVMELLDMDKDTVFLENMTRLVANYGNLIGKIFSDMLSPTHLKSMPCCY